jgi:hypothetical protein
MTSDQHGPYAWGDTDATMVGTKAAKREGSESHQSRPQFGLESETRLHEAGIASNRESATSR